MVKGFSKFLKYKNKTNNNSAEIKRSSRKQEKHVPACYECGDMGHVKPECPILKLKQKLEEKGVADKHKKKGKLTTVTTAHPMNLMEALRKRPTSVLWLE